MYSEKRIAFAIYSSFIYRTSVKRNLFTYGSTYAICLSFYLYCIHSLPNTVLIRRNNTKWMVYLCCKNYKTVKKSIFFSIVFSGSCFFTENKEAITNALGVKMELELDLNYKLPAACFHFSSSVFNPFSRRCSNVLSIYTL